MRNPTTKVLEAARSMRADGVAWTKVLAETGLNYSQAWLYVERANLPESLDLAAAYEANPTTVVAAARAEGCSWGLIAVRVNKPESQVRKAFTEATSLKSQGLRIGKGGRFYYRDGVLYQDTLKPTGTAIPKGANHAQAVEASLSQRMIHLEMPALRSLHLKYTGQEAPKVTTKAKLVRSILAAQAKAAEAK